MISILGIPLDENSSFLKGSAEAPQKIIEAFHSDSTNDFSENGINCRSNTMVEILDSLELPSGELAINEIHNATFKKLEQGNNLISIGGDHSITFPIIKAHAKKYDSLATFNNFIIQPLTFLSGTFYSIKMLPSPFNSIASLNPVFMSIDGFRFGVINNSDGIIFNSIFILILLNLVLSIICYQMILKGYKIKF